MEDIRTAAEGRNTQRAIYEYTLPEELQGQDNFIKKTIGLVKLKMSEEVKCAERSGSNQVKLSYLFLRDALVEVDGRKVNKGDGEDETILENCDAAVRSMLLEAYADMSTVENKQVKKFLGSRTIKL
jgi:hypothetical protein